MARGEVVDLGNSIKGRGTSKWRNILYFQCREGGKVYSTQNWREVLIIESLLGKMNDIDRKNCANYSATQSKLMNHNTLNNFFHTSIPFCPP